MRPLIQKPEPAGFDQRVRVRGNRWLAEHPDAPSSKFPDHWNLMREQIAEAFEFRCAYLGHSIPSGQVDHFIAKETDPLVAYEWSNFRWAEARVNLLKGSNTFLDPFAIEAGWIEIDPVTLRFKTTDRLPEPLSEVAVVTLGILNDAELLRSRQALLERLAPRPEDYTRDNLGFLFQYFPLLAESLERAGLLAAPAAADSP